MSLVRVMTSVSPPTAICPSVASGVTVPVRAAEATRTLKVGVATMGPPTTALAGTVTVMVSPAATS